MVMLTYFLIEFYTTEAHLFECYTYIQYAVFLVLHIPKQAYLTVKSPRHAGLFECNMNLNRFNRELHVPTQAW